MAMILGMALVSPVGSFFTLLGTLACSLHSFGGLLDWSYFGCGTSACSVSLFRHSSRLGTVARLLLSFGPSSSIWARWHAHRRSFGFIPNLLIGTVSWILSFVYRSIVLPALLFSHPGGMLSSCSSL